MERQLQDDGAVRTGREVEQTVADPVLLQHNAELRLRAAVGVEAVKDNFSEIAIIGNWIYCKGSNLDRSTRTALTLQFRRFHFMLTELSAPELIGATIGWQFSSRRRAARVTLGLILAALVGCAKPSVSGHTYLTFGAGDVKPVAGQVVYLLPGTYEDLTTQVGSAFDEWVTGYLIQQMPSSEDGDADDATATDTHRAGSVSNERKLAIALDLGRVSREATTILQELNNLPESVPEPVLQGEGFGLAGLASDSKAVAAFLNSSIALQERRWDLTRRLLELPGYSGGDEAIKRAFAETFVNATETRTDISGAYSFGSVRSGRYVLMIGYATNLSEESWWIEEISVSGPTTLDLTNFNLRPGTMLEQLREMAHSYLEQKTSD